MIVHPVDTFPSILAVDAATHRAQYRHRGTRPDKPTGIDVSDPQALPDRGNAAGGGSIPGEIDDNRYAKMLPLTGSQLKPRQTVGFQFGAL
jgi:hypothetical protein